MTDHESLCPRYLLLPRERMGDECECELIRKVRNQMSNDGWVAPESHEAVVETAKARARLSAMTELHRQVEALRGFNRDGDGDEWVTRADVLALIEKEGIYTRD